MTHIIFKTAAATALTGMMAVAQAGSGALEINQACVAEGCFPGDSPGFPVTLTNAGRYALTGNLTTSEPNATAIGISAADVRIDLNGFSITGPNHCDLETSSCSPGGTGRGILLDGSIALRGTHISNGQISGFGNYCAEVGFNGYVSDLSISHCFAGISVGDGAIVERVRTFNNRFGFDLTGKATIRNSASFSNIQNGVHINASGGRRSLIEHNQISNNGGQGVSAASAVLMIGNVITDNGGSGVLFAGESGGSNAQNNMIHSNAQAGIQINSLAGGGAIGMGGNTISGNGNGQNGSQVVGAGARIYLSPNLCASVICP